MPKGIDHVIVLMMENRSFDHLLGFLPHPNPKFDGLRPEHQCPDRNGVGVLVTPEARYAIGNPDHSHAGIMHQLMGTEQGKPYNPTMRGFVASYEESYVGQGHKIMRCFDEQRVPVISKLAREFAVCTRWHCSVPGGTWPNREFAHSGTSRGRADNSKLAIWNREPTIFEVLDEASPLSDTMWRIYHDDSPHTWVYQKLWLSKKKRARFQPIAQLYADIAGDSLPAYSFLEPDYGLIAKGNSQHPGQAHTRPEFVAGEQLIHDIYNALRTNRRTFDKTVFVITYDEHGGFYDHVKPPTDAKPPDDRIWKGTFAFDMLGVRVPAVIVSPWIARHTVDDTLYDHTSIIRTLRARFASTQPSLTKREAFANDFLHLFSDANQLRPDADLPTTVPLTDAQAAAFDAQFPELEAAGEDEVGPDDGLLDDMRALTEAVGAKLAEENAGLETTIDLTIPAAVLATFRATAVP